MGLVGTLDHERKDGRQPGEMGTNLLGANLGAKPAERLRKGGQKPGLGQGN